MEREDGLWDGKDLSPRSWSEKLLVVVPRSDEARAGRMQG